MINPDFLQSLTAVEDGIVAVNRNDAPEEDIEYFKEKALEGVEDLPDHTGGLEKFRNNVEAGDFEEALDDLADIVVYVENYEWEEGKQVNYSGAEVDRVLDANNEFEK